MVVEEGAHLIGTQKIVCPAVEILSSGVTTETKSITTKHGLDNAITSERCAISSGNCFGHFKKRGWRRTAREKHQPMLVRMRY